jgi:hypothetical protein
VSELGRLIADGSGALLILSIVVLEGGVLAWRWRFGSGAPPGRWLSQIAAGAALVLGLYCAQVEAPVYALAGCLMFAGAAHLSGYRSRWQA